jgi:hypothetical protein
MEPSRLRTLPFDTDVPPLRSAARPIVPTLGKWVYSPTPNNFVDERA